MSPALSGSSNYNGYSVNFNCTMNADIHARDVRALTIAVGIPSLPALILNVKSKAFRSSIGCVTSG